MSRERRYGKLVSLGTHFSLLLLRVSEFCCDSAERKEELGKCWVARLSEPQISDSYGYDQILIEKDQTTQHNTSSETFKCIGIAFLVKRVVLHFLNLNFLAPSF